MFRRVIFPVLLGVAGAALLASLGVWQLQRLAWKQSVLSDIEARIVADPVSLPENPDSERDRYLPVAVAGRTTGDSLFVLTSRPEGPGHRIISSFETSGGRRVLLDEGFRVGNDVPDLAGSARELSIKGNLHWPVEVDGFTPDPSGTLWFARDVPTMAKALGTEPLLIVAREIEGETVARPDPIGTRGVPNNHLGYAIQWFGLAIVWLGMTVFLLRRMSRRTS